MNYTRGDRSTFADVDHRDVTCDCGFRDEVAIEWHGPVGLWTCPHCGTEYEMEL